MKGSIAARHGRLLRAETDLAVCVDAGTGVPAGQLPGPAGRQAADGDAGGVADLQPAAAVGSDSVDRGPRPGPHRSCQLGPLQVCAAPGQCTSDAPLHVPALASVPHI